MPPDTLATKMSEPRMPPDSDRPNPSHPCVRASTVSVMRLAAVSVDHEILYHDASDFEPEYTVDAQPASPIANRAATFIPIDRAPLQTPAAAVWEPPSRQGLILKL